MERKEIERLKQGLADLDNIRFAVEDLNANPEIKSLTILTNEFRSQVEKSKMILRLIVQLLESRKSVQHPVDNNKLIAIANAKPAR
jgi:hypothetical protein